MATLAFPKGRSVGLDFHLVRGNQTSLSDPNLHRETAPTRDVAIWFAFGVGAKGKKACEKAKFMVYYTKKDTGGLLNGADEWWLSCLLLDPL